MFEIKRLRVAPRHALVAVFLAAAGFAACEEADAVTAPSVFGTVTGVVTVDGSPRAGIVVSLSNGATTVTSNNGSYTFSNVPAGVYTVTISALPPDVTFPAVTRVAVVASNGDVFTVNFAGISAPTMFSTDHTGVLSFLSGDGSHNPFVFGAVPPKTVSLRLHTDSPTEIRITPISGFGPSVLPQLSGTINASGAVSLSGVGTIAGVSDVSVKAFGTLINGRFDITISVGEDGRLPGGQSIQYLFMQ